MDSMMAEYTFFSSSCGRLNFLSWWRKYSLCLAFYTMESMWLSHFRSWEMVMPRNLNDSTTVTVLFMMGSGEKKGGFPWSSRSSLSWVRVLQLSHSLQEVAILPSSRTHYPDSIHFSLIIKPSAVPYDHRLHVLLTHHFACLFPHLPDCLFPHLSSLCLLSGVGTSHNISLKSAWNPALLAPWIFPVYVYRDFGFPFRGGLICVYFLLY